MNKERLSLLIEKYIKGTESAAEEKELQDWYRSVNEQDIKWPTDVMNEEELVRLRMLAKINRATAGAKESRLWPRMAAAVAIILCLSAAVYFLSPPKTVIPIASNYKNDITPGSNKAVLTLANGKKIILTGAINGQLANEAGTTISKTTDGEVAYQATTTGSANVYDTLAIPRGGQYQLKLADGTKVWLNAATILRYPENFTGKDRQVELISGEAYFEVIHNEQHPFKVIVHKQTVEDIGTHFNIKAYADEDAIKTTLIEGAVQINIGAEMKLLSPGQQSVLTNSSLKVVTTDTEAAIAWKNGYFRFNDESIKGIMSQLSRWYDVDIKYKGNITNDGLTGKISRFKNISQVLQMLESTKLVHFKVVGKEVTVIQ